MSRPHARPLEERRARWPTYLMLTPEQQRELTVLGWLGEPLEDAITSDDVMGTLLAYVRADDAASSPASAR